MKNLFVLLFSVFTTAAFAQYSNENVSDFSNWENKGLTIYDYDENGNKILTERKTWNKKTNDWQNNGSRILTQYDGEGKEIGSIKEQFEGLTTQIVSNTKIEFENKGATVESVISNKLPKTGEVHSKTKRITETLGKGKSEVEHLIWSRRIDSWRERLLVKSEVDSDGDLISKTTLKWDTEISDWVNFQQSLFSYNDSKTEKVSRRKQWDKATSSWSNFTKEIQVWNARKSAMTHSKSYGWNKANEKWEDAGRITVFPVGKNKEHFISEVWSTTKNRWENNSRNFYYYNADGSLNEAVYQQWDDRQGDFLNSSRILIKRNSKGEVLQEITQVAKPKNLETPVEKIKCVFANPYPIGSRIDCSCFNEKNRPIVKVIDVNGNVLMEQKEVEGNFKINKNLPSGSYLMIVHQDNKIIHQEKLVIVRDVQFP